MKHKFISILLTLVLALSLCLATAVPVAAADSTTIESSTMVFRSDEEHPLTDDGDGTYSGTIPMVEGVGFDVYARDGATAAFWYTTGETSLTIAGHDAWPKWDPDTPDVAYYALTLDGNTWKLVYNEDTPRDWVNTGGVPMSGVMDWDSMYASETYVGFCFGEDLQHVGAKPEDANYGWAALNGGGAACWDMDWGDWLFSEVVPLEFPGFSVAITEFEDVYTVTLTPAAQEGGSVGLTGSVVYSTYAFTYDVPDRVVATINVIVPVAFATSALGDNGYDAVRFSFAKDGPGNVTFTATDTESNVITQTNTGVWGPEGGFPLPADYNESVDWTLNFSVAGEYTITFNCYEIGKEGAPFITESQAVTVKAPVIGISVLPTSVTFSNIVLGEATPGDSAVSLENIGDVDVDLTATIENASTPDVYTTGLTIDGVPVAGWGITLAPGLPPWFPYPLALTVPLGTAAGDYTATLVFWVEAQ